MSEPDVTIFSFQNLIQARYDFHVLNYGPHSGRSERALTQADLKMMDQIESRITNTIAETPPHPSPARFTESYWIEGERGGREAYPQEPRISETHRSWTWPDTWSW